MDLYKDNTAAEWQTKLKQSIVSKVKWKVALVELQYNSSLQTFKDEQQIEFKEAIELKVIIEQVLVVSHTDRKVLIPPGNYYDPDFLLKVLNKEISPFSCTNTKTTKDGLAKIAAAKTVKRILWSTHLQRIDG